MTTKLILLCFLLVMMMQCVHAQTATAPISNDTTYTLSGDTLFTNQNFKISIGQKLTLGKGSGANGWYNTFSFKSAWNLPTMLLYKMEIKNNYDYQQDPSLWEKDQLKIYLHSGDSLWVNKIKKYGNKRHGYWYVLFLRPPKGFLRVDFKCFIADAIRKGEIMVTD
jgi:hypothetical protein